MAGDQFKLNLLFKGSRDYLQGGDIYNAINALAPRLTGIHDCYLAKLAFRKLARNECLVLTSPPGPGQVPVANGTIKSKGQFLADLWVISTDYPVNGRYEYKEEEITERASLQGSSITLSKETGYTAIEECIALTKELHHNIFQNIKGKWLFAQIDLSEPFKLARESMSIKFKGAVGSSFTISQIYQDNVDIGAIRFILRTL